MHVYMGISFPIRPSAITPARSSARPSVFSSVRSFVRPSVPSFGPSVRRSGPSVPSVPSVPGVLSVRPSCLSACSSFDPPVHPSVRTPAHPSVPSDRPSCLSDCSSMRPVFPSVSQPVRPSVLSVHPSVCKTYELLFFVLLGSRREGVSDLCFHTDEEFSPSVPPTPQDSNRSLN